MTDDPFLRPIRPVSREENEKVNLPNIAVPDPIGDKEKTPFPEPGEKGKGNLYTALLVLYKKIFSFLNSTKKVASPDDLLAHDLELLSSLLDELETSDQSKRPDFAQRLSGCWHSLITHTEKAKMGDFSTSINLSGVEKLIASIQNYPDGHEHKLGYYLTEYAGEDWLPFPFMEILKKLHRDHLAAPNSELSQIKKLTDNPS